MNRFVYCPGGIVTFDGPKNCMLGPLPGVNQSRKVLRTFLCKRISFCPFSSSPFLAKEDMYKSLSLPSGVDSAIPCFRQTTRTSYDRNCRQPEARIGILPRPGNSMDTNFIKRKNIVIRDF